MVHKLPWPLVSFGDLFSEPLRNGIYKQKEFHGRGCKIVNMGELFAHPRLRSNIEMSRVELTEREKEKSLLKSGDLIFARRSLTAEGAGKCTLILNIDEETTFESSIIRVRLDKNKALPDFYYYLFNSPIGKWLLGTILRQTAVSGITGGDLSKLLVPQPPLNIQQQLVESGRLLDDKIALSHQINQTLEQMAQALFKSWFVDFDPVIDNALDAGFFEQDLAFSDELLRRAEARKALRASPAYLEQHKPLPEAIRQLFPAAFEECAEPTLGLGGWVPEGWLVKSVSEAIAINPKVSLAKNSIAKFVDMKALPTQGYSIEDVIEKPFSGGMKFKNNDVLLARITPCLQNGKTGLVDFLSDSEAGFGSTEFIILRGNKEVHYTYVACLARHEEFRQHVMQSMVGSSGRQRVQNGCFDDYLIAISPVEIMNKFANLTFQSFKKLKQNTNESIALANLRDTLLPKLISGELRLDQIDAELAEKEIS